MDALLLTAIEQPRVAALPTLPMRSIDAGCRSFRAPITFSTFFVPSASVSLHIISLPEYSFASARVYHNL
jgi:hypothetical protein